VRAALPRLEYTALYPARVVRLNHQQGSSVSTVDLVPDDNVGLPPMADVPLMNGSPGMVVTRLAAGQSILVGWSEGDPSRPYCALWSGGEHVAAMTLNADTLTLGGDAGAELGPRWETYRRAQATYDNQASVQFTAAAAACVGPLAPLKPMFTALALAVQQFETGAPGFVATNVRIK
jgi:hypothetical protein